MNHQISINNKRYVVRQQSQKILLLSFPSLALIQKFYINATFSTINKETKQLLIINKNEITILKVALMPLQFVIRQQSFVQWEPIGAILMPNAIILYSNHAIVFFNRGNLLQKSWQIDIVQEIECLKSTQTGDCIAMKVKSPDNSLFLWNTGDPSVKPFQEIILTQSIIQWNFVSKEILTILTASELRIYRRDDKSPQFNLYHFYKIAYKTFAWVSQTSLAPLNKQSICTITLLGKKGECSIIELLATEKRTEKSQTRQLGKIQLQYKQIKMKRIVAAWGQEGKIALICQTANHALYSFLINDMLKIQYSKAFEDLLGAQINFASCYNNLVMVRDKTRWKLFELTGANSLKCLDEVDCQKAFIIDETSVLCLDKQTIQLRTIHKLVGEPIPFKYPDPSKVQYIGHYDHSIFLIAGIRFYRWGETGLSAVGFSLRNQRAQLLEVNTFQKTLLYQVGQQFLLLRYRIDGQKVAASSLKSSPNYCCALSSNFWAEKLQSQIKVGSGEQIIATFSLNRLLKILQCQNQIFQYSVNSTDGNGLVIIIKNYVFFLEIVEDEKGYQIVLLKRMNSLLYRRFSPHFKNIKLIDPKTLTFWMGNCIIRSFSRINQHLPSDPFSLPETVKGKQLQLRKTFPPHHPRLLISLIQSNRFEILFLVVNKIYEWFQKGAQFKQLYKIIHVAALKECSQNAKIDALSLFSEQRLQQQQSLLKKFAEEILEDSQKIQLKQKNPLIFESILSALSNMIPNAKSYDYFTQSIMLLHRTPLRRNSFSSMNIALLSHSLNKEEALSQLRLQKGQKFPISWQWIKNLSLPLWYDNKQQLRRMIEQVAAIEYRSTKDPFNCLFWYLLIGKKSLIATLFKNHKLISKEHDATANFLLRDFSQPKDRTAAIKNAYVLLDKKRYFHALSFFILGNSIDDCVRICIDRLKDISLAYAFILFFKDTNSSYFFSELTKGDMWMKHLCYKLQSQHIKSYNALFDTTEPSNWGYSLELAGFHPILPQFSVKLRGSVGVRRELDAQTTKASHSQDIFADFYGAEEQKPAQQQSNKVALQGEPQQFKQRVIRYYLRQGLPLLSLLEDQQSLEALQYYTYEKYKLSGLVDESVKDLVEKLEDKPNLVKCLLSTQKYDQLNAFLKTQIKQFNEIISPINFSIVIDTKKNLISDLVRFSYQLQTILFIVQQSNDSNLQSEDSKKYIQQIKIIVNFSKALICLLLNNYEQMTTLLQKIKKCKFDFEGRETFWNRIKPLYQNYYELQKQKTIKQMDHFEHAFIAVRRRQQQEGLIRQDMQISKEQCGVLILRFLVINHLLRAESNFKDSLEKMRKQLKHTIENWIDKEQLYDIHHEFKVLIKEGTQSKIKLNLLKNVFQEHFVQFYDIVALTHQGYFETKAIESQSIDKSQQLQAIQIFRNRQDGLRNFVINQHDSRGLEVVVMFKKGLKKIQVCESLITRQRNRQNLSLAAQDSFYTILSNIDPRSLDGNKYEQPVRKAISHILQQKIQPGFPRSYLSYSGKQYIRQVQAPYLDYNELNSIECHQSLPFFFIGGKGNVEVAHLSSLKNFDRIKCPEVSQIVKLHSFGQRIGVSDSSGNLGVHILDSKFTNNCVFSLKKANVVDFSFLRASVLAVLSSNAVQVYDTLLHPKRQLKFKQPFTKDPLTVSAIDETRIAVLRKNQVLIYDTRMQKLQGARELKGKGKSMLIQGKNIYVGQSDGKVKVFSLYSEESQTIKLGLLDEKDRQKTSVQELRSYGSIVLASTSQGSIFYLPKLN